MFGGRFIPLGIVASSLAFADVARADAPTVETSVTERASARAAMARGDAAYEAGRFAEALEAYRAADRIVGVPTTAYAVGRAHYALSHLVEAEDALLRAIRYPVRDSEPAAFAVAREAAAALERELTALLAEIDVEVAPSRAASELRVDGAFVPLAGNLAVLRLDPGKHVLTVTAPGYDMATYTVSAVAHDKRRVAITLARRRTLADVPTATWVAAGMAAASFVTGVAAGAAASSATSEVLAVCPGDVCDLAVKPQFERAYRLAHVSNVAFATAVSSTLAGLLSLTALPEVGAKNVRVDVSANGLLLEGRF